MGLAQSLAKFRAQRLSLYPGAPLVWDIAHPRIPNLTQFSINCEKCKPWQALRVSFKMGANCAFAATTSILSHVEGFDVSSAERMRF
jgi:hypothetical protein